MDRTHWLAGRINHLRRDIRTTGCIVSCDVCSQRIPRDTEYYAYRGWVGCYYIGWRVCQKCHIEVTEIHGLYLAKCEAKMARRRRKQAIEKQKEILRQNIFRLKQRLLEVHASRQ